MTPTPARPTMRTVAQLAGVSLKTVSRVINDEPNVSPELVERVLTAARQLDYRPNFTASNLRRTSGSTRTVGMLLEDVANPFSASLLRAVEDTARERGVAVVAASVDEHGAREEELAKAFLSRQVDGLIIAPVAHSHAYLGREMELGTPVVFVDRPPRGLDADSVVSDNVGGARLGVQSLVAAGHTEIGFLGDLLSIPTAADRLQGYREALAAAGIAPQPSHQVTELHAADRAEEAARRMLLSHAPPTALFTAQNLITIGAVRALRSLDLHRRIALVGFDDFLLADLLDPSVSVVAQDVYEMGTEAARLLFERIDGTASGPGRRITLPTRLIERASGAIPPR